jgi:hypothetical protein
MKDYELVVSFNQVQSELKLEGYNVSPVRTGFFIHATKDDNGKIVADCQTVDGLRGFLQGIQWAKEKK